MHEERAESGVLYIVGLGPGAPGLLAPDAAAALARADTVVGYQGYLDQVADRLDGKALFGRALGEEVERARLALGLAQEGRQVALVSSGDAGVYGMAGVALELAAERGSAVPIEVVPGITAACAAAARLGAPLAHDWACISLSDLLTPWDVILQRIDAAARADFVLVFYNPASRTRTRQLPAVAERLLRVRPRNTPVGLVENASRAGERTEIVTLDDLAAGRARVNMFTTVVAGSTRTFVRDGRMVTPRIYAAKTAQADEPARERPGDRIMAESLAIIDRELGPEPSDPAERTIVRRVVHASADFELARTLRFSPTAIDRATAALRSGATIVCDVEMLRAGVRRDLADPLGVEAVCTLNHPDVPTLAATQGLTRSAAGMRLGSALVARAPNAWGARTLAEPAHDTPSPLVGEGWGGGCEVTSPDAPNGDVTGRATPLPDPPPQGGREEESHVARTTELFVSRPSAILAVGNAPTALDGALQLIREQGLRPACVIGLPVGFVGVEAAKSRLIAEGERLGIPFITNVGRKGGTAVTAAVVNALLELAATRREARPPGPPG